MSASQTADLVGGLWLSEWSSFSWESWARVRGGRGEIVALLIFMETLWPQDCIFSDTGIGSERSSYKLLKMLSWNTAGLEKKKVLKRFVYSKYY